MRVKHFVTCMLVLLLGLVLTGCAGVSTKTTADETACATGDINGMLTSGEYRKKVDNFLIIQDASSSMRDRLGEYFVPFEPVKLDVSKKLLTCLNNTLPDDFDVNAGMRIFGPVYSEKGLIYGMTQYSKTGLESAIGSITGTGGITPIANALIHGGMDLKDVPGKGAVIIVSDGLNMAVADPVAAAASVKEMYGENICIYTVLIDNNPKGKMLMEQIAAAGECGFATEANKLMTRTLSDGTTVGSNGMADFVSSVFLEKAPPKPAPVPPPPPVKEADSDGDGVVDSLDKCPNTPKGTKVDSSGCPIAIPKKVSITLLVEFDFDKAVVKPTYHNDLEKVADFLKAYPNTSAELEGHTDSRGADEYNEKLSKRRAESVKNYLIQKFNIDAGRLSAVGYGESQPVDTNETAEGRQRNRRVVATIVTTVMK
ncbi:MAG: OmpA family protein [Deltaproteobacteria bacterium]|nr:OmpA family protein [Deltaproteobacteria bacterium]